MEAIHVERLRQQRTHITHRLFTLPHLYKIQNFRRIRQRILHFLGKIGVAVLANGYVLNVGELGAHSVETRLHRQRGKTAEVLVPVQSLLGDRKKNLSVFDDRRRSVSMKHVEAKNQHLRLVPFLVRREMRQAGLCWN